MKEYSSAAVLIDYFNEEPAKGFWGKIADKVVSNARVPLIVEVPKRFYKKNELICKTVSEEINKHYSHSDLANHVIIDVLDEYSLTPSPLKLYEQFKQISSSSIVIRYYDEIPDLYEIEVYIKRKDLLTLEMFLFDLEEIKDHNLTVEKLIELKYIEMCNEVLNNERDLIKEIIDG